MHSAGCTQLLRLLRMFIATLGVNVDACGPYAYLRGADKQSQQSLGMLL